MENYIPTNQFLKNWTRICQSSRGVPIPHFEWTCDNITKDENGWTTLVYLYSSLNSKRYDKMHHSWHSS
jgi:hypothetical protein